MHAGPRSVEAFDGPNERVFRARYESPSDEGPEQLAQLELFGLGVGKPISPLTRTPLWGLYWPGTAQWLPELLTDWKWKLEKVETVAGEPCARLVAHQPYDPDVAATEIVWLDLSHNCLVRRHQSPAIAGRLAGRDFIVDEFQRLEDGLWFPKSGRVQLGGLGRGGAHVPNKNEAFIVTDVAVNESIDLSRFQPPAPAIGTVVIEPGKGPYKFGSSPTSPPQQGEGAQPGSGSTSSQISAAPTGATWKWWSFGLAGASVVFLAAGLWYSRQK